MNAFHSTWTRPFFARNPGATFEVEPFELLTTALSALRWRSLGGSICMITDGAGAAYYHSCGLEILWDGGIRVELDCIPPEIDPCVYWAAGKLFALRRMELPCVMMDTDFIVWKDITAFLRDYDCAAIHREGLVDSIYPPLDAFSFSDGLDLSGLDWTVQPLNTALAYFASEELRDRYCAKAEEIMLHSPGAGDALIYMVFAEQRLLAMLAENYRVRALSDIESLFTSGQQYFTHVWGFKQQMRDDPQAYDAFCGKCAARLLCDHPREADTMRRIPSLARFFDAL